MEARSARAEVLVRLWRKEWFLGLAIATAAVFLAAAGPIWAPATGLAMTAGFVVLFVVILGSALAVVRHAENLAARLGEPLGTLILTLSVISIEVISITAVMLHGENNPTLVRDSLLSVVMLVLNGMVGLALLIGAWRHREQSYNLQGANAYLGVILPLAVLSLVVPTFTDTTAGPTLSFMQGVFLAVMSAALYAAFLGVQTGRHRAYFIEDSAGEPAHAAEAGGSILGEALLLLAYMAPIIVLAEQMAHPIDYLVETIHAPPALGGLAIAALVATPEAISAAEAALANHLQRAVNISLGSVLATIGLTVPSMVVVSGLTGRPILLGVQGVDLVLLALTLMVSIVTFASGRTNVLQGLVHLLLFGAYLLLLVQG
jgi:Ca2+:H+ antiporter